ncbi:Histidine kinase (fragment) [Candidatus Methylobacter favarea]|uniref:histidine kinase n=1 Tax=Candidatus Methylobacter favarea TaxID=2707345 RepID=A0A8S0X972_9GAMM
MAGWNAGCGGKIHYSLDMHGGLDRLPEPIPVTVFRIVQEGLTNIAKHSAATHAKITLTTGSFLAAGDANRIILRIEDNGIADNLPFKHSSGIGLPGIQERVIALGGRVILALGKPSGLIVEVELPVQPVSEAKG